MNRKRWLIGATALVAAGLAALAAILFEPAIAPQAPPAPSAFSTQLKLDGARVVALGDCVVCHTKAGGRPFAGGLPLATPFGTIYATNITPDVQTGIGHWSQEAFARALRRGIARDGHQLYPAFPYVHFTHMSDHDIAAAYAYLMSREPVSQTTPPNALIFPLNFRPLVAFWNVLFLRPGPRDAAMAEGSAYDAQLNRGKQLVDGLGHCASCHSPLNAIGGEKRGHEFDGGIVDGWEAPALNALGDATQPWSQAQLATYLRTGRAAGHGAAAGPMLPVTRDLATVPPEDVDAIAAYILSIQKPAHVTSQPVAANSSDEAQQRGAVLFAASCAQCHGPVAPMQSIGQRPTLAYSTAVNAATPRNAIQMMLNGIGWHGEDAMNYMPTFAAIYDDRQIADLAAYLRGAYSTNTPWPDAQALAAQLRQQDSAR